jgi:hypothetical protein
LVSCQEEQDNTLHNDISHSDWNIFHKIFEYLFSHEGHKLFGKLFVSGAGALEFSFKDYPKEVSVTFDDECHSVPCSPCDPGQDDKLEWHVVKHKHHHVLVIEWEVSAMRTIYWKVCP